jgi:hypothetical protein
VILAQDAEALGQPHAARHGLQLLGEDFHERRFAAAVRAREAVALTRIEGHVHLVEQHAGAEVHRDVIDRNHSLSSFGLKLA